MNDAPIKQPRPNNETSPRELSEPHFDDIAVLIAKPVEPITRHDWFAWLEGPRMMIGILIVAGLLGTTALALTLQMARQPQVDSAATEIQPEQSPAKPETPLGSIAEQLKSTPPRMKNRRARINRAGETASDAKPVARRVGVIYGSSSERP